MATYASPKQIAFATKLINERVTETVVQDLNGITSREISRMIDALLRAPRRNEKPPTAPGFYVNDGTVIRVQWNKDKTHTYAKRLVIDSFARKGTWTYAPGIAATLATAVPLTVEEAARLGHAHGVCMICGRELTVPKSVEDGIGPVCIKKIAADDMNLKTPAFVAEIQRRELEDDERAYASEPMFV
jgi:uncharacterized protein DUF6011